MIVRFVDIGVNCWPSLVRGDCLLCWYWCELLKITHQQTEQSSLSSDGQHTISLEMPVTSQGHYDFHSFPVVNWFCLSI
jgi:hypothetical protein